MKLNNLGRLESLIYLGDEDYNDFDSVEEENRLHERPDLCAFLLLDKICPNPGHDLVLMVREGGGCVCFDVDLEKLNKVATVEEILTLKRCGVSLDEYAGMLEMSLRPVNI